MITAEYWMEGINKVLDLPDYSRQVIKINT